MDNDLESLRKENRQRAARIRDLERELARGKAERERLESTVGWKIIARLQRLRATVMPPASKRDLHAAVHALRAPLAPASGGVRPPDDVSRYQEWIGWNTPTADQLERQRRESASDATPRISIITPVFNPPADVIEALIRSVLAQTWQNWELCLADGASTHDGVRDVLTRYAAAEPRIRVQLLDANLGISGNSMAAVALASGEFLALVDHDDLLAPDMLYEVAAALRAAPDADIVYFDEDKVSADGQTRNSPWFKPANFSPDLLLSTNYLMHSVVRRSLFDRVGGFDNQTDGAQDWDLMLRLSELSQRFTHIPKVLYHWRQIEGSASRDANAKPYAIEAQRRAVSGHLTRKGEPGVEVSFPGAGNLRVIWPATQARVCIVIPTKDKLDLLEPCVASILAQTRDVDYEIVIVDTGSSRQETLAYFANLPSPKIRVLKRPGPFNWSAVNNEAARTSDAPLLLFLNNDTVVTHPDWLSELAGWASRPGVGVVGCKLSRPDGSLQHAGLIMGLEGHGSHIFDGWPDKLYTVYGSTEWYRNYHAVTGACMMVRRDVFEALGGFDEQYAVGYSDIELCLRAVERGERVVYTPYAHLIHHEGGTRGFSLPAPDVLRATYRMWPFVADGDGYFNPNLSYASRRPMLIERSETSRESRMLEILYGFGLIDRGFTGPSTLFEAESPKRPDRHADGKLTLLLISHDLSLSGAPLVMFWLASELKARGHAVRVAAYRRGPLQQAYQEAGIETIIDPFLIYDARVGYHLCQSADVVLANTVFAHRVALAARAVNTPHVLWIHETEYGSSLSKIAPAVADAFAGANHVIFPAARTQAAYSHLNLGTRQHLVYYGLPAITEGAHAARPDTAPAKLKLLCVASIEQRKGQDVLLRALRKLSAAQRAAIEVTLIGRELEPKFAARLTERAQRMPYVTLGGELPHEETLRAIGAADVFVLPSRDEALPITLLEAMAMGKAIVSTTAGGIAEALTHGESALLAHPGDADDLATQLRRMIDDAEFRRQCGVRAQDAFNSRFSIHKMTNEIEAILYAGLAA
jgi:O-antigen biosynthesis protein